MKHLFALMIILSSYLSGQSFMSEGICKDPAGLRNISQQSFAASDDSIDIKYYCLNLTFETAPVYVRGNVEIHLTSKVAGLSRAKIDLSSAMTVDSIYEGNIKAGYDHSLGQIKINLLTPMQLNEERSLIIYYRGLPVPTGFGSFGYGAGPTPFIWTLSQPNGAKDWWPCKNSPDDKADSAEINITVPAGLKAVSNGKLITIADNGNGTKTHKWQTNYPISSYLIAVTISDFSLYTQYYKYSGIDSMRVDHYLPQDVIDAYKSQIDKTTSMLSLFSSKYGEYPFIKEKYGHVLFGKGGGMEHQTITSIGGFADYLIAHELSHQWFGDKITCRDWSNIWLNEGFATYSEALYFEGTGGKASYRYFVDQKMNIAKSAVGPVYVSTNLADPYYIFDYARTYAKGGVVLHMLRGILGDSLFFKAVKAYANDPVYSYSTITTDEFRNIMERETGQTLGYFIDEWIYGEGYPAYKIDWSKTKLDNGLWKVSLSLMQGGNRIFTMPVKIKITTESGDTVFNVINDQSAQVFNFILKGEPFDYQFDPDNFIMKDIESVSFPGRYDEQKSFVLRQNFPNPFTESTSILLVVNRGGVYEVLVYNAAGERCGVLHSGYLGAGIYLYEFKPGSAGLPGGVYFIIAQRDGEKGVSKAIYLR